MKATLAALILLVTLAACAAPTPTPPPPAADKLALAATPRSLGTLSPSATPAPTATPTPTAARQVAFTCSNRLLDALPPGDSLPASLLLREGGGYVIVSGSGLTRETPAFPPGADPLALSPDGTRLALLKATSADPGAMTYELTILSPSGASAANPVTLDAVKAWLDAPWLGHFTWGDTYWINDRTLIASVHFVNDSENAHDWITVPFDLETGEWRFDLLGLPGYDPFWGDNAYFSPDESAVLDDGMLYDIPSWKVIWDADRLRLPNDYWSAYPHDIWSKTAWSGDSQHLALIDASRLVPYSVSKAYFEAQIEDVLVVDRQGREVTRLVNPFPERVQLRVVSLAWSPDSRKLAYLLAYPTRPYSVDDWGPWSEEIMAEYELFIYDLDQNSIAYHCPLAGVTRDDPITLAWSPDGSMIAMGQDHSAAAVYNLAGDYAVQVSPEADLIGWWAGYGSEARQ